MTAYQSSTNIRLFVPKGGKYARSQNSCWKSVTASKIFHLEAFSNRILEGRRICASSACSPLLITLSFYLLILYGIESSYCGFCLFLNGPDYPLRPEQLRRFTEDRYGEIHCPAQRG